MNLILVNLFILICICLQLYHLHYLLELQNNGKNRSKCEYLKSKKIKAYCINRLKRNDRLKTFMEYISNKKFYEYLDITVINAVEKDNLIVDTYNKDFKTIRPGEVGCYLSHIKCLMELLSLENNEYAIIFEDDSRCLDDLQTLLETYEKSDYDLLILGHNYKKESEETKCDMDSNINSVVCTNIDMVYGSHAYIVNKKAANILVSKSIPIMYPYDIYYSEKNVIKGLKVGVLKNNLCTVEKIKDSDTV